MNFNETWHLNPFFSQFPHKAGFVFSKQEHFQHLQGETTWVVSNADDLVISPLNLAEEMCLHHPESIEK